MTWQLCQKRRDYSMKPSSFQLSCQSSSLAYDRLGRYIATLQTHIEYSYVYRLFIRFQLFLQGVLLFGPPGTGKTLLAKAVCSSQRASFFSCAASSLVSKFRGESEKIVRCLFEAARFSAPSVIFLDELDALVGKRSTEGQVDGHEASRRLKTELFTQMDGLGSDGSGQ